MLDCHSAEFVASAPHHLVIYSAAHAPEQPTNSSSR